MRYKTHDQKEIQHGENGSSRLVMNIGTACAATRFSKNIFFPQEGSPSSGDEDWTMLTERDTTTGERSGPRDSGLYPSKMIGLYVYYV